MGRMHAPGYASILFWGLARILVSFYILVFAFFFVTKISDLLKSCIWSSQFWARFVTTF